MAPPAINIDAFRGELETRVSKHQTQNEILGWLRNDKGVVISRNTLSNRINIWKSSRYSRTEDSNPLLLTAIKSKFKDTHNNDTEIATSISSQGLHTTKRQVKRLRLAHDMRFRNRGGNVTEARNQTFAAVDAALEAGTCRSYGRGLLQSHLRLNGHMAREDDVRDALSYLDPQGSSARKPGVPRKNHDGEFRVPGPDFMWAIDGHDKFRNFGIEIYAGVDVYSRRIMWMYVGNSNRRQVSILRQMVLVLETNNKCPKFWRSDRGNEVLLLADSHYSFYQKHRESQGDTLDQVASLPFRSCYMFGSSTANIKIESTWMRMIQSQTKPWQVSFTAHA